MTQLHFLCTQFIGLKSFENYNFKLDILHHPLFIMDAWKIREIKLILKVGVKIFLCPINLV